jgi:Flp pilus assembly protein TadG
MINKSRLDGGQAIIEFAFVLPVVLILLLGILEFGVLFYNKAMVTNASREGARAAIVYQDTDSNDSYDPHSIDEIKAVVSDYLIDKLITFEGTPDPKTSFTINETTSPGGKVGVLVTYEHTFLVISRFLSLSNKINLSAETIMRVE